MVVIPQKELRNQVGEVLRRAEAGEEFTITVSGRPVATLGPANRESWVPTSQLADLWALPPDLDLAEQISKFDYGLINPWER
jgi:prevent-host-death family protein